MGHLEPPYGTSMTIYETRKGEREGSFAHCEWENQGHTPYSSTPTSLPLWCTAVRGVYRFLHSTIVFFYNLVSKLKREREKERERDDDECPDTVKKATTARRAVV